jgi:Fe-S cluster assembly protein SufD
MAELMSETQTDRTLSSFTKHLRQTEISLPAHLITTSLNELNGKSFPTTRSEAWKYTRLTKLSKLSPTLASQQNGTNSTPFAIHSTGNRIVIENGAIHLDASRFETVTGLTIKRLSECNAEELQHIGSLLTLENEPFNALNTAFMQEGIFIQIADKAQIEAPIELIHLLSKVECSATIRLFVHVGKFAKAELTIGTWAVGADKSILNAVTEIHVGEGAHFTLQKLQSEDEGNFQICTEEVEQEKDSVFNMHTVTLNGTLVRNNVRVRVNGTNCETNLYGAYLLKGNQHTDNHTVIDHMMPHCNSNELYKGVIDEQATAVFNGKVFVRKDAQKINAFQSNGNVLMTDTATVNSKPELEIYADDVKCSHGSTTGQLDEEAVFYLQSRGISERSARNLLVEAFIGEVLDKNDNQDFVAKTNSILNERFGWER